MKLAEKMRRKSDEVNGNIIIALQDTDEYKKILKSIEQEATLGKAYLSIISDSINSSFQRALEQEGFIVEFRIGYTPLSGRKVMKMIISW